MRSQNFTTLRIPPVFIVLTINSLCLRYLASPFLSFQRGDEYPHLQKLDGYGSLMVIGDGALVERMEAGISILYKLCRGCGR